MYPFPFIDSFSCVTDGIKWIANKKDGNKGQGKSMTERESKHYPPRERERERESRRQEASDGKLMKRKGKQSAFGIASGSLNQFKDSCCTLFDVHQLTNEMNRKELK